MNKFVLEPTDENLERHKRVNGTNTYWHTADFFQFNDSFKDELDLILDAYIDAIRESEEEDEDEIVRKIGFSIGKMLVKAARKAGISPQDYRDQFNNYASVIWTPICIWRKDNSGKIDYTLMS